MPGRSNGLLGSVEVSVANCSTESKATKAADYKDNAYSEGKERQQQRRRFTHERLRESPND